jgi:ABC-2 type transport system permease protein
LGTREIKRVFRNEFRVISSDKKVLAIFLLGPIIVMAAFGAATMTTGSQLVQVSVAIVDEDQTPLSNSLVAKFEQSQYVVVKSKTDRATAQQLFNEGQVDAIVTIDKGFENKVRTFYLYSSQAEKARVGLRVDNSYFVAPVAVPLALQSVMVDFYTKDVPNALNLTQEEVPPALIEQIIARIQVVNLDVQMAYGQNIPFFSMTFPMLTPIVLFTFAIMMCGLTIVGERIRGTLPRLLKTPIRRSEIVIGKLSLYLVVALWHSVVVLSISMLAFGLVVRGSVIALFAALFLTSFTGCTWGIFYSTFCKTERQVVDLKSYTLITVMILGGIIFPLNTMPPAVQTVAKALPLYHSLTALRSIAIKGLDIEFVVGNLLYLLIFGMALLGMALITFRFVKE